jgi:hypothetical protein
MSQPPISSFGGSRDVAGTQALDGNATDESVADSKEEGTVAARTSRFRGLSTSAEEM